MNDIMPMEEKNLAITNVNNNIVPPGKRGLVVRGRVRKYLTAGEVHTILANIPGERKRDYLFINTLWCTGLRITEAINLKVGDVDFESRIIKVLWQKSRRTPRGKLKRMEPAERYLPVTQALAYQLSLYCGGMNKAERLFPYSRQYGQYVIRRACEGLGLAVKVSPHTLRHSFAVHFLTRGGNLKALQELLGHAQITTTMIYLQIVRQDLRKEIEAIEW